MSDSVDSGLVLFLLITTPMRYVILKSSPAKYSLVLAKNSVEFGRCSWPPPSNLMYWPPLTSCATWLFKFSVWFFKLLFRPGKRIPIMAVKCWHLHGWPWLMWLFMVVTISLNALFPLCTRHSLNLPGGRVLVRVLCRAGVRTRDSGICAPAFHAQHLPAPLENFAQGSKIALWYLYDH